MKNWQWAVLGVFVATGGLYGWNMVRGIRNDNPGNLRRSSDQWQGLRSLQTDSEFFQFRSAKWGIRAMARVLLNYQNLHGLRSIEGIISRWAPTSENNTSAYIESVSNRLGVHSYENIAVVDVLPDLIKAIIKHENGVQPYSEETINESIALV